MPSGRMTESQEFYGDFFSRDRELGYNNRERYETVFGLIDSLNFESHSTVLDIGSGSGRIAQFLANRFETVVSVDITDNDSLRETLTRNPEVRFVQGALPALPVVDSRFDLVVCSEVIEHLPSDVQPEAVIEIKRVMTDDGRAVLSTPNPSSFFNRVKSRATDTLSSVGLWNRPRRGGQPVENWIPPDYLQSMLQSEFDIEHHVGSYYLVPPFNRLAARLPPFRTLRRASERIRKRGWLQDRGLYQYYVVASRGRYG